METWQKIIMAIGLGMLIIFLIPRAKHAMENSPKGTAKDWHSALIPILIVVLFVVFLIQMV
ncbi:MAG: hypothetical protein OEX00_03805 [Gammaproteobacteria bacterium]|nr:hypothetical protein [Gammaproteobacteria bacterium]MDH5693603.1 hypothetical protein [Gammaproteobacteria bacterium]